MFDLSVNSVLQYHAVISIAVGGFAFVLPHRFFFSIYGEKSSHNLHEMARLYGALTLAQGWLTHVTRKSGDSRIKRAMGEAYAISYALQALAMLRAQWTSPNDHGVFTYVGIVIFTSLSVFYAYCRWMKTIKIFELPTEACKSIT